MSNKFKLQLLRCCVNISSDGIREQIEFFCLGGPQKTLSGPLFAHPCRDLHSSPSIIRIIKSRRVRWGGHVARMGEKRQAYKLLVGKTE
jgi:hypothetical protein